MPINMGLGKLADLSSTFVRQFRFILEGKYLKPEYVRSVVIDYSNKTIHMEYMEVVEKNKIIHIHDWINDMESGKYKDEELKLTTYDGCGIELYCFLFSGIELLNNGVKFIYNSSEESRQNVVMKYEKREKIHVTDKVHKTEPRETEIGFLNSKMFIQ